MKRVLIRSLSWTALAASILFCGCKHGSNGTPPGIPSNGGTSGGSISSAAPGPGGSAVRSSISGNKQLVAPEADDIFLLYYATSGAVPAFSDLADLSPAVQSANEFKREGAHANAESQLKARLQALTGTRYLQVNLDSSFGQYDDRYKEYDLDMGNGTSISYNAFGKTVDLVLTNGGLAQSWKLPPDEAADVLKKNGGFRNVQVLLHLEILDAPPTTESQMRINTRVLDYDIRTNRGDRLGHVEVTK